MADDTRRPRVLDTLTADQPWEVPDEWLTGIRDQLRSWSDDPNTLRPVTFPEFVEGTPAAVWFTHQVAPLLTGWIPVLHGEYADIAAELTRDYHRAPVRLGGAGHLVRIAAPDWPLQVVSGARSFPEHDRLQALQLSRDVVNLFVDAPPMAVRARALTRAFDRVLADREVTRMHTAADYETIAQFWRATALSDGERAVLPELAGPTAALTYSLRALQDAHAKLLAAVPDDRVGDFAQVLGCLILATGLDALPADVGQILGGAGWDVVNAIADTKGRFDPHDWLGENTAWLARAVREDRHRLARGWVAAAARISVEVSGVLDDAPWPELEVPDLGAFFQLLERDRWQAGDALTGSGQVQEAPPLTVNWGGDHETPPARREPGAERAPQAGPTAANTAPADTAPLHATAEPAAAATKPAQAHGAAGKAGSAPDGGMAGAAGSGGVSDTASGAGGGTPSGSVVGAGERGGAGAGVVSAGSGDGLPAPLDFSEDPLAELDSLIGLESVKDSVRRMVNEIKANMRRQELGLPSHERARHMVFVGKPGTAKTTIARLLSRIYKQLGVLEKGHVVEVDRSDLVGASVGQTAPLTAEKFREALGGVLFVDEAYTLVPDNSPGDFGLEAVATLLKMMEDHRNDCVVIVAGYHREMQRFMESNTGLASRFPKMLSFTEYSTDELVAIFALQAQQKGMLFTDEVLAKVRTVIPPYPRSHNFGNGRFIRNVLEEAIANQATRLSEGDPDNLTERDLRELLPDDVKAPTSMRAEDYLLQKPGT